MSATQPATAHRAAERSDRSTRTLAAVAALEGCLPSERHVHLEHLIALNMSVAESVAARYRRRGVPDEDLAQVAYLALVRVAQTYDPSRGHDFLSYAVPSIRGEVRRYFRDQGWMVRPPRRIQETQARIASVESELASRLGRPAKAADLAAELQESLVNVEEALGANGCFTPTSLDQVPDDDRSPAREHVEQEESGWASVEARVVLTPVIRRLSPRERKILEMRFFGQRTQKEIGAEIGVTQMQVSRLLSELLARLRIELEDAAPSAS